MGNSANDDRTWPTEVARLQEYNLTLTQLANQFGTDKGTVPPTGTSLSPKHYTTVYEGYLRKWREQPFSLIEIGVSKGSSLKMWEAYFLRADIYGIDINPFAKKFETKRTRVFIGNQSNKNFLQQVTSKIRHPLNVIVDDGSHLPADQKASFDVLFPELKSLGYYFIEDLRAHHKERESFVSKLLDNLHSIKNNYPIKEISFTKGLVAIQKA